MLKILLEDRGSGTEYQLPCIKGDLGEFARVQAGNYEVDGITWVVTKGLNSGNQYINISKSGTAPTNEAAIRRAFEHIGITLDNMWLDMYDTTSYCDLTLISPDQEDTYPLYKLQITNDPDIGQQRNRRTYTFNLEVSGGHSIQQYQSYTTPSGFVQNVYCAPLVLAGSSDNYIFGAYRGYFGHVTGYAEVSFNIEWNTAVNTDTWIEPDYEPGDKGFKPTGSHTSPQKPGVGGRGSGNKVTPEYFTQHIDQPGEPNESEASAAKSGFIKAYEITEANLQGVGACLWGTTLAGFLSGMLVNPLDFIVSLAVFPYRPHMGSSTPIKFGRWKCTSDLTDPAALGENASGFPLTQQFRTIDFGTINIPENWGSFLDYEYTTIELYLPFIGVVDIDTSECMGGTINVQYTIDYYTGMCVANVKCTRPFIAPNGFNYGTVDAQHSYQGNCAIQIPLSRTDYGAMVGNLINACTQAISNPAQGAITLIGDAVSGGLRPSVSSKGNIVANSGYCSVLYPYVRITRPITAEPDSYQEVVGYPSYIDTTLGQCEGKCVCKDIKLTGIHGATDSELERIKQACREGIYI